MNILWIALIATHLFYLALGLHLHFKHRKEKRRLKGKRALEDKRKRNRFRRWQEKRKF